MPLIKIKVQPGVNSQATQVQAAGGWWDGNLIRWRMGQLEKMAGWLRLIDEQFAGFIRRMNAWLDLENHRNLLVGTDAGLQLVHENVQHLLLDDPIDPQKETWHVDNLGEDGLALKTGGKLHVFHPPTEESEDEPVIEPVPEADIYPANGMFVAMPQAQVILWGTVPEPERFPDEIDPLYLRFSEVGTYDVWAGLVTNQAGSMRLGRGSRIVGGLQAPQTSLIFTDMDLWSMSYVGPPLVYGFTVVGTGCGLIAPHAVVTLGRTTFWQGPKSLWQFGDTGVQPLPCSVHDYIFEDLDVANIKKCHAAANSIGNEVAFHFPSRKDGTGECTRYAKYNVLERAWDKGKLPRTAWINQNVFGMPIGADQNKRIQQHERGFNDDDQPMRGVFAETGYSELGDGTYMTLLDQCHPDFTWFGSNGGIRVGLKGLSYPASKPVSYGPFSATPTTQYFTPHVRGRYVALRYDWEPLPGFSARVGATVFRAKRAGQRP